MSTLTTNYGFTKPAVTEASGPEELAENMMLAERALINLELGSNTGRQNKNMTCNYRNVSDGAISVNTEGSFTDPLTWLGIHDTGAWTTLYDVDEYFDTPSLGLSFVYNSGSFEFYHQGYYRLTWNVRLQMSATTMTEGFIRAALLGTDGYNTYSVTDGILGSPIVLPMNTMTNITDIGTEQLVKITQPERTTDGVSNSITTGKNQRDYWVSPFFRYFTIGIAQNNSTSATATPLLTESYIHMEFVRGL